MIFPLNHSSTLFGLVLQWVLLLKVFPFGSFFIAIFPFFSILETTESSGKNVHNSEMIEFYRDFFPFFWDVTTFHPTYQPQGVRCYLFPTGGRGRWFPGSSLDWWRDLRTGRSQRWPRRGGGSSWGWLVGRGWWLGDRSGWLKNYMGVFQKFGEGYPKMDGEMHNGKAY